MGWLLDITYYENTTVLTLFKIISIGITGDSDKEYFTTALHLGLWKLELTTSISWRKHD